MRELLIEAPCTGHVLGWLAVSGQMVKPGELLGELLREEDGLREELRAPARGILSHRYKRNERVERGAIVATVRESPPPAPPAPVIPRPRPAPVLDAGPAPVVEELTIEPVAPRPAPAVQELVIEPRGAARPRIVRHRVGIRHDQVERLIHLTEHLGGGCYDRSELERVAFDLLLGLPRAELQQRIERQRDDEQRRRYGYGARPR